MSSKTISVKWVAIGAAIIILINWLGTMTLAAQLYPQLAEALGQEVALYVATAILAVVSFFAGGLVIGWLSPGETLLEPAYACVIAIAVNGLVNTLEGAEPNVIGLAIAGILGFGLGLAGAKVGERLQGDTTDKMRERGELER